MATFNRLDKLESDPRVLNASFSPLSLSVQAFMSRERADPLRHESAVALQFQSQSQCLQQCNSHCSVDHVHVHVSQNSSEGISASTAVSATSSNTMLPPAIVRRVNDNEQKSSSLLHGHTQFALRENISNNQANLASARLRALAPLPLAHANTHITVDANGHPLSANSSVANRSFIDQNQAQTVSLTFIDEQTNTNHSNNNYPRMPSPSHAPVTPSMALVTPAVPPLPIQHFHHSHSHSHPYRPSSRSSKCFSSLAAQSPRAAQVAAGGPLPPTPQLTSSRSESLASNGFSPERSTTDTMTTANTATSMSPSPSPLSSPEFSACSCPSPEPALQSPSRLSLCSTSLSFPAYHSFSSLYAPILSSICHFLAPRDIASRVRSVSCHWRSVSFSPLSWRCAVLRVKSLDDLMNCLDAKKVPAMRALTVTLDTDMEVALEKMDQSITQLRAGLKTPLMRGVSECGSASAIQQSGVRTGLLSLKVLTLNDCSFVSPMALSHLRAFQHVQSLSFGRLDKASCEALFLALASFDFPYLNSLSISNSSLSLSSAHVCLRWHNTAPMLKTLSLEDVKGVGRALGVLAHLKGIETLKLAWNEDVTDASIASLIHPPPPPAIDTKNGTAPFSPPGSPMLLAGAHRQSLSATNNANINADANNGVNDANQSQQEPPAAGMSPVLAPAALYHSPLLNLRRDRRQLSSQDVCAPSLSLSLRTLDLQTCKNLTSAAMEHIAKLPDLTDLDVGGTAIGNDGLGFLAVGNLVHTLIRLNLTHCENVSCEGLKHISKFKVLQELYLEKTSIRDRGIKFLCTHHAMMHRVDPNRSPITAYKRSPSFSAAAAQQAASSPMCGSVTSPSCSSASSLPVLPFLHTLDLSCTMVTSASFAALSLLPALRSLNLSSTRLSSLYASAALAPSRFLCRFTTLTSLNVNWCMQLNVLDIFFLVSHLPALIQINQSTFRPRAESEEEKRHRRERLLDHEEDVEDDESDEEDSDEGNSDVDSDSRSSDLFSDDPFGDDALNSQSNGSADTVVVKVPVNSLSKKIDRLMRKRRRIGAEKLIARAKARFQFHSLPSLPASPFFGAQTPTFNGVPSPLHSPTHSAVAGHSLNYSFSSNSAIPLLAM